jgi:NADH-quinone oxidoreductase subunit L
MFMAAGVGAYGAAMFHLFTHAFFKALLFLGAGSVIHAMHHEQDMRYYGGLRKHIPITFWAMMAGTLAITGVGIIGVFGFAGFYSKDAIIEAAFASGTTSGGVAFAVAVFAALLTSFYSWRLVFLTFFGKPRWAGSEHIQHAVHDAHGHGHDEHHDAPSEEDAGHDAHDHAHDHGHGHGHGHELEGDAGYHPHESPFPMLIPLVVLTLGAIFAGFLWAPYFIDAHHGGAFWAGSLAFDEHLMEAMHHVPMWVKLSASVVMITGFLIALWAYVLDRTVPARFTAQFSVLYDFLLNKWYFDQLYHYLFVVPAFWLGRFFWKKGDQGTIDRFGPNGVAALVVRTGTAARAAQSGYLYTYALVMLLGLAAAATWAMVG